MLNIVEEFSNDIGMQFGLDKCRVFNVIRGQIQPGSYDIENGQNIEAMDTDEVYKNLGVKQARK